MIAYYSTVDRVNRKLSTGNMNWHPNFPVAAGFHENKPVFANSVIIITKSTKIKIKILIYELPDALNFLLHSVVIKKGSRLKFQKIYW